MCGFHYLRDTNKRVYSEIVSLLFKYNIKPITATQQKK